ncbi:MAG: hypothetical protein CVU55_15505 [Deltaproteobacteria bacterium HGW-Deltaproteobacteria-13]|nr:MAG: hypothetical protein CVU55_15505 [Deltaproteobacteria bacterium HGW-Deltaproteobacteria-13]
MNLPTDQIIPATHIHSLSFLAEQVIVLQFLLIFKNIQDLWISGIYCLRSIADTVQAADYLIFDKTLFFDGRSIAERTCVSIKYLTGSSINIGET